MKVIKRTGQHVEVDFNKISIRLQRLCQIEHVQPDLDRIDVTLVSKSVVQGLYNGVTTDQLDDLSITTAESMLTVDPQYSDLAARVAVSALHKKTPATFSACVAILKDGILSDSLVDIVSANEHLLNSTVNPILDYKFSLFALSTLSKSYLLQKNKKIIERPGYLLMRVSIGIHGDNMPLVIQTYHDMAHHLYLHATPTLFNSGTRKAQLASCFLLQMEDSIDGIYKTLTNCAKISQCAGGIGICLSDIRAKGSLIKGTNGFSNGIVPLLRVFNESSRYVDQGGGKRKGSIAFYLEVWHADILDFLDLRKNSGNEHARARDLFTALWVCDLFMQRVRDNESWTLFCPNDCPGLTDCYGEEFNELYKQYEAEGRGRSTIVAQKLWQTLIVAQIEGGTPYILFKDACNAKSNQKNLGTIKCSNLCAEIIEYTAPDEIAVCNLASINVTAFATDAGYDYQALAATADRLCVNLNKVIDASFYPVSEAKTSNNRHRPIGIGIQGLANLFLKLKIAFASSEALALSTSISEAIYYGALTASIRLAKEHGAYSTYAGSPFSQGVLQFDFYDNVVFSGEFDWKALKVELALYGTRNSLLTSVQPTASTASILHNSEAAEALSSNLYVRRVSAGEFVLLNRYLVEDMITQGKWNKEMADELIENDGNYFDDEIYKTVWQISQKSVIDMAAARAPFIDQSSSMNLFLATPTVAQVSSMLFYAHDKGLKSGLYYLRSTAKAVATKFVTSGKQPLACSRANPDCEACSG